MSVKIKFGQGNSGQIKLGSWDWSCQDVRTGQVGTCHVKTVQLDVSEEQVKIVQVKKGQLRTCQVGTRQFKSRQVSTGHVQFCLVMIG